VHYPVLTDWTEVISMHFSRFRRLTLLVAGLACLPAPAGALISVGSLDLSERVDTVVVEDGLAYVRTLFGLLIVDVSNPEAPVEIGAFEYHSYSGIFVRDMEVAGELAFLAVDEPSIDHYSPASGSLRIIDVSDPTAPVEIGTFEASQSARGIAVVEGLAYLTAWNLPVIFPFPYPFPEIEPSDLHVIDVSNPAAPFQVGNIKIPDPVSKIEVLGNSAYILDAHGFRVIDVSDPTAPVEIGEATIGGLAYALTIVDSLTYVGGRAGFGGGLTIFDVSDPTAPTEVGYAELPDPLIDIAIEGETAYAAAADAGLQAIDISDPTAPVALGRLNPPEGGTPSLAVADVCSARPIPMPACISSTSRFRRRPSKSGPPQR